VFFKTKSSIVLLRFWDFLGRISAVLSVRLQWFSSLFPDECRNSAERARNDRGPLRGTGAVGRHKTFCRVCSSHRASGR
jgi:hypothetical protein